MQFEQFKAMTQEGQSDKIRLPIIKLISVILSSYIIRLLLKQDDITKDFCLDEKDLRAIHITISSADNSFYNLKKFANQ